MTLRAGRPEDLSYLSEQIAKQPLMVRYGSTPTALSSAFARALDAGHGFIVAQQEMLLGMAWFERTGIFGPGGYLRLIALCPGSEGQGIGGLLLDEVERQVGQKSRALFLLVSSFNEGARRFYARRGYTEMGTLKGFVRDDIDEILCVKKLI